MRLLPVEFDVVSREGGRSSFSRSRLFALAFDGILSFSTAPLRMAVVLGAIFAAISISAGLYFLGPRYDPHLAIPRRTSAHDWLPRVPPELARPDEAVPFVSSPAARQ